MRRETVEEAMAALEIFEAGTDRLVIQSLPDIKTAASQLSQKARLPASYAPSEIVIGSIKHEEGGSFKTRGEQELAPGAYRVEMEIIHGADSTKTSRRLYVGKRPGDCYWDAKP